MKKFHPTLLFLLLSAFALNFYALPQNDGANNVDPDFNVQILSNGFDGKKVEEMLTLPDDKILASGSFSSFNRQPVGELVRLTADGLLDTTFNNNLIASNSTTEKLYVQPDGKILITGYLILNGSTAPANFLRLNADGTLDSTFNSALGSFTVIEHLAFEPDGKILALGRIEVRVNGVPGFKRLVRLNSDGTIDGTFNFTPNQTVWGVSIQNNKPIVVAGDPQTAKTYLARLNTDGSFDNSFEQTIIESTSLRAIQTTPDNKILLLNDSSLRRYKENGGADNSFQTVIIGGLGLKFHLSSDGKITYASRPNGVSNTPINRVLADGTPDPTFSTYNQTNFGDFAVQSDGEIFIGDLGSANQYVHLFSDGTLDTAFNSGGIGFQIIKPSSVNAVVVQPDRKIIIAGKFDVINNVDHSYIARLNADGTTDNSFRINIRNALNAFYVINDIYTLYLQPDGKIIVTGFFTYVVNGTSKDNVVRLNTDGSIDPTFNLGVFIQAFPIDSSFHAKNKITRQGDGKIIVASSDSSHSTRISPTRINSDGSKDSTFTPTFYSSTTAVYSSDVAIRPDQKILVSGATYLNGATTGFLVRLNANGSADPSFQKIEEPGKIFGKISLLPDGKILVAKSNGQFNTSSLIVVSRFNADGSPDTTFSTGTIVNGFIHEMLPLPTGQILLGGSFTTFNGEARQNLALLNADGSLAPTNYNVNKEVLSLAVDAQGRVIVSGSFTTIQVNGQSHERTYIAWLTNSLQNGRARFDFDGDGRSDLAVFAQSSGNWSILHSQTNQPVTTKFGQSGDKTAAADFDGDGKTDVAVYRPANGNWYLQQSTAGFTAVRWGAVADKPVPADYDGDGKADVAVWRLTNGTWYILQSSNSQLFAVKFGQLGDIALDDADFDGDARADIAVWRPSNGTFYWLASGSNYQFSAMQFGQQGDFPAVADYNGDGKDDFVVFRPSVGTWFQNLTTANGDYTFSAVQFGKDGDIPVAADYDGDGKTDIAVRRNEVWHILKSGQGYSGLAFGSANAQAVAALRD